jgi:hypothetical protein
MWVIPEESHGGLWNVMWVIPEESHGGLMETEGGPYSNTLNKTMIARVFIMDIFFVIT